jgi:diguanylate cyclase (GGDEF)-like protein
MEQRAGVVIVDDDPDIVTLLERTVGQHYRVYAATSGVEALGLIGSHDVAAILTDQKMPGMTGVQLARAVHREDAALSVVLLTAYTDPQDVIAAINEGEVFRFVTKPWNVSDLMLALRGAIERTQLARENRRLVSALNRQISAISLVTGVGRDVGVTGTPVDVFAHLLRRLPGVIDFDLGAALLEDPAGGRVRRYLHVECASSVPERGLIRARDRTLELFAEATARGSLDEAEIIVRVGGAQPTSGDDSGSPHETFIPVGGHGGQMGIIALYRAQGAPFTKEDARLLDVLASEITVLLEHQSEALAEERRHFSALMSSLADGVIVARLDGSMTTMNTAARGMLGLFPDTALDAQVIWQMLGTSPRDALESFETRGPAPVTVSAEILGRPIAGVISPVFDAKGRLHQVAYTLRDSSQERDVERAKDDLIATMSHELRTPLAALQSALDLAIDLHGPALPPDALRYVSTARDSSDRLRALLDDVLDLAKQRAGELAVRRATIDIAPVLEQVTEALRAQAEKSGVRLLLKQETRGLGAHGDEVRIAQVVTNLISNAIKFAKKGSAVKISAGAVMTAPGFIVVSVWNDGPAIPKHEHARIFRRFEQGSTAAQVTQRGSGLGLSISASLVEAHDGCMWVDSNDVDGTKFSFAIPCERFPQGVQAPWLARTPGVAGMRVLVIDDDLALAEFLRGVLSKLDVEVEVASDGDHALSIARRVPFDVILTDVKMGQVDGLMLCETLRHDPVTRHIPVVVFSVKEQAEAARRAGASVFLPKPLDVSALCEKLLKLREERAGGQLPVVLIADGDPASRRIMSQVLSNLGSRVLEAGEFASVAKTLDTQRVDVLLLAAALPDGDAIAAFEAYRASHTMSDVITLFLSDNADTALKVRAFHAGGDDFLQKPIDALELGARVDSALRRRDRAVASSPTTRLPGGAAIEREVATRIAAGERFVLCYFDVDNLKAFNDVYGYAKTDGVIQQTGDILREAAQRVGGPKDFVGHIAGDDFVCVFSEENAERICEQVMESFDRIIPLYYDSTDRKRGYIEAEDRYGAQRQFPIMSISVAALMGGADTSYATLATHAADVKRRAKAIAGSSFVFSKNGQLSERRRP